MSQRISIGSRDTLDFAELPGRRAADPLKAVAQDEMSVRLVVLPPDVPRTAHYHPHCAEFFMVLEGRGYIWWDGEFHRVQPGDTVFLPKGVPHATVPTGGEPMKLVCFFPRANLPENLVELDIRVDEAVRALEAREADGQTGGAGEGSP